MNTNPVISQKQLAPRDAYGRLQPGARLNPNGRPFQSGDGFRAVLQIVADIANSERFRAALRKQAEEHPFQYARAVLVPLAPAKQRKALRAQIRAAEEAAHANAAAPFSNESKTQ